MRTAFIQALSAAAESDDRIFLICGDLGYSVLETFAERFPDRFLNAGIAEQNMIGLATGLSLEGYTVFVYSIGNFPTLRPMEQIRYDVCYHNSNVKIVAVGGGYAYGPLGASHHATEEIGMLRLLPNLTVCAPGDPVEATHLTRIVSEHNGPCYIRLGKAGEPTVHSGTTDMGWGRFIRVHEGCGTVLISSGATLKYASDFLRENKKNWELWSAPFVKPMDTECLATFASRFDRIVTLEEHQLSCGFGSAVLEALNDLQNSQRISHMPIVKRIGINDEFVHVAGSQSYLRKLAGITLDGLE